MKKLFIRVLPWINVKFIRKTIDFRRWYYVWIGSELMPWWALEYELEDVKARYNHVGVSFRKIPLWKTIIK